MKTIITFLLFVLHTSVFAQSYLPIPEANAVWIQGSFLYSAYNNHEHATITQPLSFGNDSLIESTVYHTLHGHAIADWVDGWGNPQTYLSGTDYLQDQVAVIFRQDIPNKRVYQWDNAANQEVLLYDFENLTVGQPYPQTATNIHFPQLLVMAYDSIVLMDGLYHERWILGSNSSDSGFVSIIEGMGSTMGFHTPLGLPFEQSSATLCFSINGNAVYEAWENPGGLLPPRYSSDCSATVGTTEWLSNELEISAYPNPVNDILYIKSNEPIVKLAMRNVIGQSVHEQVVSSLREIHLSVNDLASGNYLLTIYLENHLELTLRVVR